MKKQFIIPILILSHLSCGQKNDASTNSINSLQASSASQSSIENRNSSAENSDESVIPITQHNEVIEWYKSYKSDGTKIYDDLGNDITSKIMTVINNYDKINTNHDWTDYSAGYFNDDDDTDAEINEVKKYRINGKLAKITTEEYRNQGRIISEYYILNGKLSFLYQVRSDYNRPFDYDEKTAKANNDTEYFDIEKSTVKTFAHFFHNGKLFHTVISDLETKNNIIISDLEDLKSDNDKIMKRFKKMTE